MILIVAAVSVPFILLAYKNGYRNLLQLVDQLHFVLKYFVMGVRENILDIANRSSNQSELLPRPGEVAVITGGARGIGLEVVRKLLYCDVTVIIGCRNVKRGHEAFEKIRKAGVTGGDVKCYQLDVSSLASIRSFADTVLKNHSEIHYLINNAGIMYAPRTLTEDGFENQLATNYLGHCYLTHLLLPKLAASARAIGKNSRIVNVSSCIHYLGKIHFKDLTMEEGYMDIKAYAQSKLAQILFTKALDARLIAMDIPVQVYAVHPGITYTDLFNNSLLTKLFPFSRFIFKSSEEGARSILHACISSKLDVYRGTYITNCNLTETGGLSNSLKIREKLWTVMMDLLQVDMYGGMMPREQLTCK